MNAQAHFIGGPLDGQARNINRPTIEPWDFIDAATGAVYEPAKGLEDKEAGSYPVMFTHYLELSKAAATTGPLPEVTVHGTKLMTLGQLQQFLDAARQAGCPEDHVPRVANSFSGRIRALTAKD